jgi:hypothetical protein
MNTNTGGQKPRPVVSNLSAKANERNRTHRAPLDVIQLSTKPTKNIKTSFPGGYTPRKRHANEAMPQTGDWKNSVYKVGDGDTIQHPRPGSMHAYTLPSRGYRT